MSENANFNLAHELFDNLIAFNKGNQIAFAGDAIVKLLSHSGIDIEAIVAKDYNDKEGQNLLLTMNKVRTNRKPYVFRFKKNDAEMFIFPAKTGDKENVIMVRKNEMDRVNMIEHDLRERVKELACLYNISMEIQFSKEPSEAFEKSTESIKQGFQFPQFTTVIIEYDNEKFISSQGQEKNVRNLLTEYIIVNSEKRGQIKVIYHKKLPFLKEEYKLLKEISLRYAKALEKYEKTALLEKQKKILLSKNRALTVLTKEYKDNKEKLQTFFKAITDKIVVIDSDYNIILSNSDEIESSGKCHKKLFNSDEL